MREFITKKTPKLCIMVPRCGESVWLVDWLLRVPMIRTVPQEEMLIMRAPPRQGNDTRSHGSTASCSDNLNNMEPHRWHTRLRGKWQLDSLIYANENTASYLFSQGMIVMQASLNEMLYLYSTTSTWYDKSPAVFTAQVTPMVQLLVQINSRFGSRQNTRLADHDGNCVT